MLLDNLHLLWASFPWGNGGAAPSGADEAQTSWTFCLGPVPGRGQAVHGGCDRCLSPSPNGPGLPPTPGWSSPLCLSPWPRTPWPLCRILSGPWTRIPLCSL